MKPGTLSLLTIVLFAPFSFGADVGLPRENIRDNQPPSLVVHEWGTFTSVAGEAGDAIQWTPLASTPDLPCFVHRLSQQDVKMSLATIRMETPVLYFYPSKDMSASVHVTFPQGCITEWYPKASATQAKFGMDAVAVGFRNGHIAWDGLQLSTDTQSSTGFPTGKGDSRYYAARNTDSAALSIAGEREKLIFYRGIGYFGVPINARYAGDVLEVRITGAETVPMAVLFDNQDGRIGYRFIQSGSGTARIDPPELNGDLAKLRQSLIDTLVGNGLYRKEAEAMLETWHDSWFEPGTRLIYIVPRAIVDRELPLAVAPASSIVRVFVGRIELLSPPVRNMIEKAIAAEDIDRLAKLGRFFNPFVARIHDGNFDSRLMYRVRMKIDQQAQKNCIE